MINCELYYRVLSCPRKRMDFCISTNARTHAHAHAHAHCELYHNVLSSPRKRVDFAYPQTHAQTHAHAHAHERHEAIIYMTWSDTVHNVDRHARFARISGKNYANWLKLKANLHHFEVTTFERLTDRKELTAVTTIPRLPLEPVGHLK